MWVLRVFCVGMILFAGGVQKGEAEPVLADYDAEVRTSAGRVDVPTLVKRLTELNVTAYFYLIWHRDTDWDDLKVFLPAAQAAGIDVWVYLVPPSESPPFTSLYSEPFRLDYLRWADEIAKLSIIYPNLKAFVIDDFWANRTFFTPDYVQTMQLRARAINPNLAFWPLMYYREIDRSFVTAYRPVIDGVVAAYPQDAEAVGLAWRWLNDKQDEPAAWRFVYPGGTRSAVGDFIAIQKKFDVEQSVRYQITLKEQDSYEGPTSGYHVKQVLVDGEVVWAEDVGGGVRVYQDVTIDVTAHVQGKQMVDIALRVIDLKPVSNFEVVVSFQEPQFEGFHAQENAVWVSSLQGAWTGVYEMATTGAGQFHVPLIVMVAADRSQFVKRWGEPASPERIRDKLKMALVATRQGIADGVVTYALHKEPGDAVYDAIRRLLLKSSTSTTADFDQDGQVGFSDFLALAQVYGMSVGENAVLEAAFDLDLDGAIGFGDFLLFAKAFRE